MIVFGRVEAATVLLSCVIVVPFVHPITARFFETDRAGIVFFGRVFEYCHSAYEELMRAIGFDIDTMFDVHGVGMPLVHAEADFERPIRMGDVVEVSIEVERLGKRSIRFKHTLTGTDGVVRATARLVHAFVVLDGFHPCGAPEALLDGLRSQGLIGTTVGGELAE